MIIIYERAIHVFCALTVKMRKIQHFTLLFFGVFKNVKERFHPFVRDSAVFFLFVNTTTKVPISIHRKPLVRYDCILICLRKADYPRFGSRTTVQSIINFKKRAKYENPKRNSQRNIG